MTSEQQDQSKNENAQSGSGNKRRNRWRANRSDKQAVSPTPGSDSGAPPTGSVSPSRDPGKPEALSESTPGAAIRTPHRNTRSNQAKSGTTREPGNPQQQEADSESNRNADSSQPGSGQRSRRKQRRKSQSSRPAADSAAARPSTTQPASPSAVKEDSSPQADSVVERKGKPRRKGDRRGKPNAEGRTQQVPQSLRRQSGRAPVVDADEPALPIARDRDATDLSSVDAYIKSHRGWQREALQMIRSVIRETVPDITESIKWSQPVFELGGPVCYLKAFNNYINFGFWRGTELTDNAGLLVGDGMKMRHITIGAIADIQKDLFVGLIQQSVKLNKEKGDPTVA